jgi:hypothetical protein
MQDLAPTAFFAGDLGDPWVAEIASALPPGAAVLDCAGDLPGKWPTEAVAAPVVVLHRAVLTNGDADRVRHLLGREDGPPRLVLVVGPHARHHQVERWAPMADAVVPEAIAPEVLARHVPAPGTRSRPESIRARMPRISVVSTNFELRTVLATALRRAGYRVQTAGDWSESREGGPVVWDVPVLEPAWAAQMARVSAGRTLLALLGFADRDSVSLARSCGASACLELPCDPDDLVHVADRLLLTPEAAPTRPFSPAHAVPPAPMLVRKLGEPLGRRPDPSRSG